MAPHNILAILFGLVALAGVIGGGINRFQLRKAIGAQFIRYNVVVITLPAATALAFQGLLIEAAGAVFTGALGYAFAGFAKDEK